MKKSTLLLRCIFSVGLCLLTSSIFAATEQNIYQGPLLEIIVEHGNQKLPIGLVNHLNKGDRLWVHPQSDSLAKGDWILLLATISPSGNHIQTQRFDLSKSNVDPVIDITDDTQSPVLLLAPQVRNMFGLYTSFNESSDLLKAAVEGDPQLFLQLQKLDLVNQAISALREDLDQVLKNKNPDEAIAATRQLASNFGVKTIDPECFKNNLVNTPCVALSMVTNRDFVIPTSSDLSSVIGQQKADDLTSYLTSSLHVISAASDFLTNKFRDQYDFAPAFGRQQDTDSMIRLFALSRFRNGDVKTVYVYTPAWFNSPMPQLRWTEPSSSSCLFKWQLNAHTKGHLPVMNYWHDWQMTVIDPTNGATLVSTQDIHFKPGLGILELGSTAQQALLAIKLPQVLIQLHAAFGFTPLDWPTFTVVLPEQQNLASHLDGLNTLVSGETANLNWSSPSQSTCVQRLSVQTPNQPLISAQSAKAGQWTLDLSHIPPSDATLWIDQSGVGPQSLAIHIQKPKAQITSIEHANLDAKLLVRGELLQRIDHITWADTTCSSTTDNEHVRAFTCDHDIRNNASLPDKVRVTHIDQEPVSFSFKLTKTKAAPLVSISNTSPNALLIQPSSTALQWGLGPTDQLLSQDSGLIFLLQTQSGYQLESGNYHLELKLQDDPTTSQKPISAALITDMAHNELRTRNPVVFNNVKLPSVVNPIFWRVVQDASGLSSDWQAVNRSVLLLPELKSWSCASEDGQLLIHGTHLELIDAIFFGEISSLAAPTIMKPVNCDDGLCLQVAPPNSAAPFHVQLHWLKERPFDVRMPPIPSCQH